ncbi:hypothetical protein ZOSMA_379G00120 [Zostera marina]|uniref:Uncharacterized protein n=1 Tax=Zostera marina TaxID=29655 RepID=A0A0K9P7Q9_ZOSMR|nr:hypothetical protein ZOSMA_379G00120 [Zostera marina]
MMKAASITSHNIFVFNPRLHQNPRSVKMKNNEGVGVYLPAASVYENFKAERSVDNWFRMTQTSSFSRYAYNEYSDENSDRDNDTSLLRQTASTSMPTSTHDNVDEWKWKLSMFLRNGDEHELVSRERKDRRDFDHLSAMATRMGLFSRQYAKVVVFSKTPLPNYRSDLDEKRPLREVSIPPVLQREVDYLLDQFLARKRKSGDNTPRTAFARSNSNGCFITEEGFFDQDSRTSLNIATEKILYRKSLQLASRQCSWQESSEGKKMQEFRQNLPAYKEKETLLAAIAQNQVFVISLFAMKLM